MVGCIDSIVSSYNEYCRSGLATTVRSAFDVYDNINIINPQNIPKFNLASVNLTEATNIVYAYCDVSKLFDQFSTITDYSDPEQYITIGSRVSGSLVNTVPEMRRCIDDGKRKGNGYDVGKCGCEIGAVVLDTKL